MGLVSGLLTLPLAPVRGVVWVATQLEREADRQRSDPAAIRMQLAEIDAAYEAGAMTEAERDAEQDELVGRLLSAGPGGTQ